MEAARRRSVLAYPDPRLPALGLRVMIPPHRAADAAASLGATLVAADEYDAHRIALGIPRGGVDFRYGDAFPHEADMDQLGGVDFTKGCYVGQEVVSRMEHRGIARTRTVPVRYDGAPPQAGAAVTAGERQIGTHGLGARGSWAGGAASRPRRRRSIPRRSVSSPTALPVRTGQARLGALCIS